MSFSGEVKEELCRHVSSARHCRLAELAAITAYCGNLRVGEGDRKELLIQAEYPGVAKKCFTLWKKTFNISITLEERTGSREGCSCEIPFDDELREALGELGLWGQTGETLWREKEAHPRLLGRVCCKRAFLRGAFLSSGSISDPAGGYHLEFVCHTVGQAAQLLDVLRSFEVDARIAKRKKYFVAYLKDGSAIVEVLNIMGAHVALMNLENARILKEMRNTVNRRVNCDTANISKTVTAAARQIADIRLLQSAYGLDNLPDGLREAADVRLRFPELPLQELGERMNPPIGKSGVNHRLRRLSEMADDIRNKGGKV